MINTAKQNIIPLLFPFIALNLTFSLTLCLVTCVKTEPDELASQPAKQTSPSQSDDLNSMANYSIKPGQTHADKSAALFFVILGSQKKDSIAALNTPETIYGIDMFCEDDFISLPEWSIVFGSPKPTFLPTHFLPANFLPTNDTTVMTVGKAYMTFDAQNHLQRTVLRVNAFNEEAHKRVYETFKSSFDSTYLPVKTPPLFSLKMPTNEVIKGYYEPYYLGHVYEGAITYRTDDGYLLLYKRTKGEVITPDTMRFSLNGVFAEYANLGSKQPVWKDGTPKQREVMINHYSADFAQVYQANCDAG